MFAVAVGSFISRAVKADQPLEGNTALFQKASEWPNEKPLIRLGDRDERPTYYASVDAPIDVVKAASSVLLGEPATWKINHIMSFATLEKDLGKEVVCLTDKQNHHFICMIQPDRWIRLNEERGLLYLNLVLEKFISLPSDLKDPLKTARYVEHLAFLYKGPQRVVLSKEFLIDLNRNLDIWLQGKEANPDVLRSLCKEPVVIQDEHGVEIRCNIITNRGGIEHWVLNGQFKKSLAISKITATQIHEDGTFSYGRVGG